MTEAEAIRIFEKNGAIVKGHFVYTSWEHGEVYVDKDMVLVNPVDTYYLGYGLAEKVIKLNPDIIIGPETGGALIAPCVGYHLSRTEKCDILSIYAKKDDSGFKIRPRHIELIPSRRIVIVDDILTTGGSLEKVVKIILAAQGIIVGIAVLWNRGDVKIQDITDIPGIQLFSLVNKQFDSWQANQAEPCPLCEKDVPINTDIGHGKEFLEKQLRT